MIGHSHGAAGAIDAIASVKALSEGTVPPTINYDEEDPECDVPIVTEAADLAPETVVSNAPGFGGTNCVLVIEEPR